MMNTGCKLFAQIGLWAAAAASFIIWLPASLLAVFATDSPNMSFTMVVVAGGFFIGPPLLAVGFILAATWLGDHRKYSIYFAMATWIPLVAAIVYLGPGVARIIGNLN